MNCANLSTTDHTRTSPVRSANNSRRTQYSFASQLRNTRHQRSITDRAARCTNTTPYSKELDSIIDSIIAISPAVLLTQITYSVENPLHVNETSLHISERPLCQYRSENGVAGSL